MAWQCQTSSQSDRNGARPRCETVPRITKCPHAFFTFLMSSYKITHLDLEVLVLDVFTHLGSVLSYPAFSVEQDNQYAGPIETICAKVFLGI